MDDHYSRTVEDAADWQRRHYDPDCEPEDDHPVEDDGDDDNCGCSDPCCPCSGRKVGVP